MWKPPWTSRAVAADNQREERRVAQMEWLRADLQAANARYDTLLEKYHALKLQGAVVVEPPKPVVITPAAPDPVRDKIREQVRANPSITGLGGYLTDYARELRDERNMTPAQIVVALGKWESSEEQSAPVDSLVPMTDEEIAEAIR
jgi:hypothetical protein